MTSTEHEATADLQPSHGEVDVDNVVQPASHATVTEHSTTTAAAPAAESNAPASTPPPSTEPSHTEDVAHNEPPPPAMPPRPAHESGQQDTNQDNADMSPEVASLKAMFPDFDPIILQSVLESVGGSQDRAIDMLLGMSDPEYVPQQTAETRQPTQTELDEELARRLTLEEEEEQRYAGWDARGGGRGQQPPNWPQYGNVPYQPRTHGNHFPQGPQPQGQWGQQGSNPGQPQQGSAMNDVQEQFSKIAETGKKTFSSLVTKVKAKMQEFDQSRASSGQAGQQQSGSGAAQTGRGNPSPSQSQSYYDPNHGGYDTGANPTSGYDVTTNADAGRGPPPPVAVRPAETTGIAINDMRSQSPGVTTAATPRPPVTSTGAPVDPSKIGLLPKRPVSLVGASPQGSQTRPHEDEEELDYVENPFEDHRR